MAAPYMIKNACGPVRSFPLVNPIATKVTALDDWTIKPSTMPTIIVKRDQELLAIIILVNHGSLRSGVTPSSIISMPKKIRPSPKSKVQALRK